MTPLIEERMAELEGLCREYQVKRLDLFGSAAGPDHAQANDLDFLVEYQPERDRSLFQIHFGLLAALEELFGLPVDLVSGTAIDNPYFLQSVEQTRKMLYEA